MFISSGTNTICAPNYLPKSQRTLQISPETPSQSQSSTLRLASPEDELLLSGVNRLGTYSLEFSLRILHAVSQPGALSPLAEAALAQIETTATMAVHDSRLETGASTSISWVPPDKAFDDIAAEYGEKKMALDAFYADESLSALLDGMGIEDAGERESILAVLKDIYAARDAELTEKYTEYAKRRIDDLSPFYGLTKENPTRLGITLTAFQTAMEAVWKEKMEIAPKLAATVDKEHLAEAISQYSLKNSAVKLNVDGVDFSYKDVAAIWYIYQGESAAYAETWPPTFETINLKAAAAQLLAENTMSPAAAKKFMEMYKTDLYDVRMEEATRNEVACVRQFYSKALGISVSPEKLDRILQELNDQAKLFRVLATVPAESFKDSFQEAIGDFAKVAWKYNKQVDVAGLVNGWNDYLKYSKSDFADLSGYEIKTAVDIRV